MWGGIHALQTTRVAPPNAQKYPSIVPLKASQSFLPVGAVCALVVVWFVASEPVFFPFFSIFLFENYSLALLVVGISTLIFFFSFFFILALL